MDNETVVREELRRADPDRYFAALFAPQAKRRALIALYAFDAEIASIRLRVTEPMAGEMRIRWWQGEIAASDGSPRGHPLLDEIETVIAAYGLPRAPFEAYLEARVGDLYDDPFEDRNALEGYCGETSGAVLQLACMILDAAKAPGAAAACGHGGCMAAIVSRLAHFEPLRRRGQLFVSSDLLQAIGVTREAALEGEGDALEGEGDAAERYVAAMADLAREHHRAFLAEAASLAPVFRPVFAPLAVQAALLARIARDPSRVTDGGPLLSQFRRNLMIAAAALRGVRG